MAELSDLYVTLEAIKGGVAALAPLLEGFQKEVEARPTYPDVVPAAMPPMDPAVGATLDQINAGLVDLAGQVKLWRTNPPSLELPAQTLDFGPISGVLEDIQETMRKLPSMLNIRIGSGGIASPTSSVHIQNGSDATINPATEETLSSARDFIQDILDKLNAGLTVTPTSGGATETTQLLVKAAVEAILAGTVPTYNGNKDDLYNRLYGPESRPAPGYALWLDTANTSFIYILEATFATAASGTGFRGVRITKDSSGNPLGKVEVNTGGTLTFNNRTTDGGWA